MDQPIRKATAEERIAHEAGKWRQCDKAAIVEKGNDALKRAEYQARKNLRKVIDETGAQP